MERQMTNIETEPESLSDVLLTTREIAKFTKTSESYWEKLRAESRGPKWVRLGRAARMRRSELDAWLNGQREAAA